MKSNTTKPHIEVLVEPGLRKENSNSWRVAEPLPPSLTEFRRFAYHGTDMEIEEMGPSVRFRNSVGSPHQVLVFGFEPKSTSEAQSLIDQYRAFKQPLFAVTSPKTFNQPQFRSLLTNAEIGCLVEDFDEFEVDHLRPWLEGLNAGRPEPVTEAPATDPLDIGVRVRDADSGRLNAKKLSESLGISMTDLAKLCGVSKQALGQRPASANIQDKLQPLEGVAEGLLWCGGDEGKFRAWLNRPNRDFPKVEGKVPSPLDLILAGHAAIVADKVHNLRTGHPA